MGDNGKPTNSVGAKRKTRSHTISGGDFPPRDRNPPIDSGSDSESDPDELDNTQTQSHSLNLSATAASYASEVADCSRDLIQTFINNLASQTEECTNYLNSSKAHKARKEDVMKVFSRSVVNIKTNLNNLNKAFKASNSMQKFFIQMEETIKNIADKVTTAGAATTSGISTSAKSYADIVAHKQRIKIPGKKSVTPNKIHKVEIKPITPEDFESAESVKSSVMRGVDPAKIGFVPSKIYTTNNKTVIIESHSSSVGKLLECPEWAALKLNAQAIQKRKPRLSLFNVPTDMSAEELASRIHSQNNLKSGQISDINPIYKFGPRGKKVVHWAVEVTRKLREEILSIGYLGVGWSTCRAEDRVRITTCFKCYKFGHTSTKCRAESFTCGFCAAAHETKECPNKNDQSKLKCASCAYLKQSSLDLGHLPGSDKCSSHTKRVKALIEDTDYWP